MAADSGGTGGVSGALEVGIAGTCTSWHPEVILPLVGAIGGALCGTGGPQFVSDGMGPPDLREIAALIPWRTAGFLFGAATFLVSLPLLAGPSGPTTAKLGGLIIILQVSLFFFGGTDYLIGILVGGFAGSWAIVTGRRAGEGSPPPAARE